MGAGAAGGAGGAGLPERGKVAAILAEDAAEVQFGQVLFRIKPIE